MADGIGLPLRLFAFLLFLLLAPVVADVVKSGTSRDPYLETVSVMSRLKCALRAALRTPTLNNVNNMATTRRGNDHLHRLTKAELTTLRVDLGDWEGNTRYAQYSSFQVGPASDYYRLNVSGYSGSGDDSFSNLNGMAFTTKGADHDTYSRNCAEVFIGAWWYSNCHGSNLNGKYYVGVKALYAKGVIWVTWKGFYHSLKSAEMKLREP